MARSRSTQIVARIETSSFGRKSFIARERGDLRWATYAGIFSKPRGCWALVALVAACKNGSIARTVIDAGVPETKGMGSNLRTWARYPEKTDLMMLADRPPLLETPLHFFLQDLTPNDAYFVRWHYAGVPTHVDLRTFRTEVIGAVDRPLQLSFDDLRTKFEPVTLTAFSQCSGNSRSFFSPRVPGAQWANGAMGNARYVGARLKDVLGAAGVGRKPWK